MSAYKTRVTAAGKRIVDSRTSADHGDCLSAAMKEGLWPIRQPDVQTEAELRHNCELFGCEHDKTALLKAVAHRLGMHWQLLDQFLMDAHVHRELIITVHGENETHARYLERVRVYDPTAPALTFKAIHGSLCIAQEDGKGLRWSPSHAYLIYGSREHLFRYALAGTVQHA